MYHPGRGHEALRRGRHSLTEAVYFLTICTETKACGLDAVAIRERLMAHAADASLGWRLRTATIMPDHVHLVIELLGKHELSAAVRLFKGRTSVLLRTHDLHWQRGYYDHRIRNSEDLLPVFLYVFLNPYRAMLQAHDQPWPGYFCISEDWKWFSPLTQSSCPFPEWLK